MKLYGANVLDISITSLQTCQQVLDAIGDLVPGELQASGQKVSTRTKEYPIRGRQVQHRVEMAQLLVPRDWSEDNVRCMLL